MELNEKQLNSLTKLTPKTRKKGVNPKSKGKTFEYEVANYLTEKTGMPFQRIFTSGAAVGQSNRGRLVQMTSGQAMVNLGDVTSPELLRQLVIWECKNYANVELNLLLSPKGSKQITGWLSELLYDVESALTTGFTNKEVIGFLCIKWTRKGSWIVFNQSILSKIFYNNINDFFDFKTMTSLQFNYIVSDILREHGWGNQFIMVNFEEFINTYHKVLFQLMSEDELKDQMLANMQREIDRIKNASD